jgi:hypothetical protein
MQQDPILIVERDVHAAPSGRRYTRNAIGGRAVDHAASRARHERQRDVVQASGRHPGAVELGHQRGIGRVPLRHDGRGAILQRRDDFVRAEIPAGGVHRDLDADRGGLIVEEHSAKVRI